MKQYDENNNIINELHEGKGLIKNYYNYEIVFEYQFISTEKNRKGKKFIDEINYDELTINGNIWKGKGKDYYGEGGNLVFEGEYLNGKRNGKGKYYYEDGKVRHEGEYLNDGKNGKGNEYDRKGNLLFKGEYYCDERISGKEYSNGKLRFKGEYLYNKKYNGKGYDNEGNIVYELINGKGIIKIYNYNGLLLYEGGYLNGELNGQGKEYNNNGKLIFDGEYLNGERWKGKGCEYKNNQLIYEGEYSIGERHGKGKEYYNNGSIKIEIWIKMEWKN